MEAARDDTTPDGGQAVSTFGPGDPGWCPNAPADDLGHCGHWYDCEPCHRCGDDTPDPNCDCPRCTYERQATKGYAHGRYQEEPDPEAPWPSGMCGQKRVCDHCPSSFLCTMKASAEMTRIRVDECQRTLHLLKREDAEDLVKRGWKPNAAASQSAPAGDTGEEAG